MGSSIFVDFKTRHKTRCKISGLRPVGVKNRENASKQLIIYMVNI